VIVSEWVDGQHLGALPPPDQLRLTYMACEAVTASIMVTGVVHADPHEGNLLLTHDGQLAFLDFGLMSRVSPQIMEAFALGIQAVVARDYAGLVRAFVATQFVLDPIERRTPHTPVAPTLSASCPVT
jgi:predicted unusual protein kinase regulating ubiquinone biosynthesis (AarF/ABC1/UbiB family)